MKKLIKLLLILFTIMFIVSFIYLFLNIDLSSIKEKNKIHKIEYTKKEKYNFELIGYYKGNNKLRYFTFFIKNSKNIDRYNLSKDLKDAIIKNGSNQMNSTGSVTVSFYYLKKENTPDITNLSAYVAKNTAFNHKPIMAIWLNNGKVSVFQNPK